MIRIDDIKKVNFDSIPIDSFWNTGEVKEHKLHRIHAYPAKFPAFISTKALFYAKENKVKVNNMADVFCGCGTVAFEAKRNNINFWGCDLNPIATMIAKVKSRKFQQGRLNKYYDDILEAFTTCEFQNSYANANERLKYWYDGKRYRELSRLKFAIEESIPASSDYRLFFNCAFSNILKATSRWLTKSIKPQIDPYKKPANVLNSFIDQCMYMMDANNENDVKGNSATEIVTSNILDHSVRKPRVDMIVTSPPYVTSYEYADLHQLSSLWLGYAHDYRDLREGSIGSLYHIFNFERELKRLNNTGSNIVFRLLDQHKSKARSVAKYFLDMQQAATICYSMLSKKGVALFIIGNTEYKSVRVNNARHLAESLMNSGFKEISVTKRKISKKILTPYRDKLGRFTNDDQSRKVYSEEFILIGRK